MEKRIVIFASGSGTNAQNLIEYFRNRPTAKVVHVFSNNPKALVLQRATTLNVKASAFTKEALSDPNGMLKLLKKERPHLIVLAGFLWKFPEHILREFPHKVINIHPALLPKYGGKGMYGKYVHEAVVAHGEKETGITIHYVNEQYDEGGIIFQTRIPIATKDSPEMVAKKVHQLEYEHFPHVVETLLLKQI